MWHESQIDGTSGRSRQLRPNCPFRLQGRGYARAMTERPDIRYPGPTFSTRLQWLMKAGPSDHLLALSVASASLPVIGKHLEPLGAITAAGIWGARHAPEMIESSVRSLFAPKDPD